jgi:predicted transcriptional regulator
MQKPHKRAVAVLLALLIATPVAAQTATLAKCQTIKDRIERYTGLRRKGGSASQMQQWKEQLRASEEQFWHQDCKDHRRKLR